MLTCAVLRMLLVWVAAAVANGTETGNPVGWEGAGCDGTSVMTGCNVRDDDPVCAST